MTERTARPPLPNRLRVASLQYFVRPVPCFDQLADQVSALVEAAADYECKLLVFPEYFSIQLLTLGNLRRPVREQVRDLASQAPRVVELFSGLAAQHKLSILGGTIPVQDEPGAPVHNEAFFFNPQGRHATQGKLHMTRFETEDWRVTARQRLKIFDTALGKIGVTICYDVEFPEIARAAARAGAHLLLVPSCTDDRQGFLRVRYCAHARAIGNQI